MSYHDHSSYAERGQPIPTRNQIFEGLAGKVETENQFGELIRSR